MLKLPEKKDFVNDNFATIFDTNNSSTNKSMNKFIAVTAIIMLLPFGCKKSAFIAEVEEIEVNLPVTRFEQVLFSADPSALEDYIPQWREKYGEFLQDFAYILQLGSVDDPQFAERLKKFVTDRSVYRAYKKTMEVFPDLQQPVAGLTTAFKHYLFYFPEKTAPEIITYVSGLTQSAITDDSLMAIGLDRYLGSDELLYSKAGIYSYLIRNMHPGKIVSDCMLFWAQTEFPFNDSIDNLITNMIYEGKLAYFAKAMLPLEADTIIWGFTGKEMEFCMSGEETMWTYLVEHKLLFSADKFVISQYTDPGPFTKDFGLNSTARAANWLGYRIVQSYMNTNPEITLPELMTDDDYMQILNLSAYNP